MRFFISKTQIAPIMGAAYFQRENKRWQASTKKSPDKPLNGEHVLRDIIELFLQSALDLANKKSIIILHY